MSSELLETEETLKLGIFTAWSTTQSQVGPAGTPHSLTEEPEGCGMERKSKSFKFRIPSCEGLRPQITSMSLEIRTRTVPCGESDSKMFLVLGPVLA